ncbi:hypothetical protein B0H10DRAFT_2196028 [Mycena sp. CBHHK59/15]|nr:hypothetical protein B0H10DRAFT_2196028 [Mycena sp. CBHHK59/15]
MKTPPMDYPDPDMKPPHAGGRTAQFANWPSFICTPAQPVPACMVQKRDEAHITQGAISEITVNIFTLFKHRRGATHYSEATRPPACTILAVEQPRASSARPTAHEVPSRGSGRLSARRAPDHRNPPRKFNNLRASE